MTIKYELDSLRFAVPDVVEQIIWDRGGTLELLSRGVELSPSKVTTWLNS